MYFNAAVSPGDITPVRDIKDNLKNGVEVSYVFNGAEVINSTVNNTLYDRYHIPGYNYLQEPGKPALPMHNDLIAVPAGADVSIEIIYSDKVIYDNVLIHPALKPAFDYTGAPEPEFEIDEAFYQQDILFPSCPVRIIDTLQFREMSILVVQVTPIQYNPAQGKMIVNYNLSYRVGFGSNPGRFVYPADHSEHAQQIIMSLALNNKGIADEFQEYRAENHQKGLGGPYRDYILFTIDDYIQAADSLAQWKRQLGYSVEVVSKSNWSDTDVEFELQTRYLNWTPKPDYFVILGDHNDVPGQILNTLGDDFASDLYYTCMGGSSDYFPDIARGRISVSSASEALAVVQKIINYERYPVNDPVFYQTGLNCAYFQEDTAGYAERRFAQTAEEILQYMTGTIGMTVNRVYYTESNVTPTNWNNGSYSAGEPIPAYLLKPGFAWDGDATDVSTHINEGTLYVLHRDHGFEDGWGDPYYDSSHINALSNGAKLPVVFSINCLTGKYLEPECFSEAFLRKQNGGAAGIFCHAEVSMSGYNDGLALGLFDAIWAVPGLVPNFTGSGNNTGTITSHGSIYTMGDVALQGLLRMTESWGDDWGYERYTYELFHYFGDPAMKIWTDQPVAITATHDAAIDCHDTTFTVYSSSCPDGLATLVIDGLLVGSVQLSGGTGVITFSSISGNTAWITVSKHNFQPYIALVPVSGGCPMAKFQINPGSTCGVSNQIELVDQSTGNITSWSWDFGSGAIPATATTQGPHYVTYSTYGLKYITLTVDGPEGPSVYSLEIQIDELCSYEMPLSGSQLITVCDGILYDNGGTGNYPDNLDAVTTIAPAGASQVVLDFIDFSVEAGSGTVCDYDYLEIFDGPDIYATSLGRFCNTTGSPGTIVSTAGSVTLSFHSDGYVNESGFEVEFGCYMTNQPPDAEFYSQVTTSCTGEISFTDMSTNGPTSWLWDFGDGNSSTMQHPVHFYTTSGTYDVTLIAINSFGSDTILKTAYISVNMPAAPNATGALGCNPSVLTLTASGSGLLNWFDVQTGGTMISSGNTFVTPALSTSTTYYVEDEILQPLQYIGETNNTSSGAFLAYEHYLVFDCYTPLTIVSVEVNAGSAGSRTIVLRDNSLSVIETATVNIPAGISRVTLDFDVPAANNLQLVCTGAPDLFRNDANTNYPYELSGVLSINYSSASTNPTGYYYYFYDWEVREPSCISSRTPVIAEIISPEALISPSDSLQLCSGDSIILTASTSVAYLWSPGNETSQSITVYNPGTYYVQVTDSGCVMISDPVVVSLSSSYPVSDFSVVNTDPLVQMINTSANATSFIWFFGDGTSSSDFEPSHTYSVNGVYTIMLIAINGCGSDTSISVVTISQTGLEITSSDVIFDIFPNPAKRYVNVMFTGISGEADIEIVDIFGRRLAELSVFSDGRENNYRFDTGKLGKGVYFVVLTSSDIRSVKKLIVQ
ncbi:MAG: C25 family cysteine peptidase [Bacteroidota bacterium]